MLASFFLKNSMGFSTVLAVWLFFRAPLNGFVRLLADNSGMPVSQRKNVDKQAQKRRQN